MVSKASVVPTPEQHALVVHRDAELRANPAFGLSQDEAIAEILSLRA